MKCKNCGQSSGADYNVTIKNIIFKTSIEKRKFVRDLANEEFIWKTGYCRMCLIDMGYCD